MGRPLRLCNMSPAAERMEAQYPPGSLSQGLVAETMFRERPELAGD